MTGQQRRCHDCGNLHTTGYSRCDPCRERRRPSDRRHKRSIAEAIFTDEDRDHVLTGIRAGKQLSAICEELGMSVNRVRDYAAYDPAWGVALDDALMAGRDPDLPHGTARGYRYGCHCPECRQAKQEAGYWQR